ncbi:MAG: SRPBCC family protein [Candidatus Ranarchaeia archaeon]
MSDRPIEKDTRVTKIIDIEAPLELVWTILTDLEAFPEIDPIFDKIEFLTKRKMGVGTVTRWHFTGYNGVPVDRIEMITEYKPMKYYTYSVLTGAPPKDCTLIFQPIENGVRVIFTQFLKYENPDVALVGSGMEQQLRLTREKALKILRQGKWRQG